MKRQDLIFAIGFVAIFIPFFVSGTLYDFFVWFSTEWAFTASFIKFACSPRWGRCSKQDQDGYLSSAGFGLIPRPGMGLSGYDGQSCVHDFWQWSTIDN
jgi:hypothetical protein